MKVNKDVEFKYYLGEAHSLGLRYALLDDDGNIRHRPCRCKDYFQDVYWSEILKKGNVKQYGFEWDGNNKNPISKLERVNVLLIPDEHNVDLSPYVNNLMDFMNVIEKELNIPYTKIIVSESDKKDLIVNYHNAWSNRPYLISLFFLLLRTGLFFEGKTLDDVFDYLNDKTEYKNKWLSNDKQQIQSILKLGKLDTLLKEKILPPQKWKNYIDTSNVHNNSGIVSYSFKLAVNGS